MNNNISLKLFMITSKRKHSAVLKSQELFTPQNTQRGNTIWIRNLLPSYLSTLYDKAKEIWSKDMINYLWPIQIIN